MDCCTALMHPSYPVLIVILVYRVGTLSDDSAAILDSVWEQDVHRAGAYHAACSPVPFMLNH
eukprot:scaffold256025_cov23-Tisochrysis_lutea.AAC.1